MVFWFSSEIQWYKNIHAVFWFWNVQCSFIQWSQSFYENLFVVVSFDIVAGRLKYINVWKTLHPTTQPEPNFTLLITLTLTVFVVGAGSQTDTQTQTRA